MVPGKTVWLDRACGHTRAGLVRGTSGRCLLGEKHRPIGSGAVRCCSVRREREPGVFHLFVYKGRNFAPEAVDAVHEAALAYARQDVIHFTLITNTITVKGR